MTDSAHIHLRTTFLGDRREGHPVAVVGQVEQHHRQQEPPSLRVRSVSTRLGTGHDPVADGEHFMLPLVLGEEQMQVKLKYSAVRS